MNAYTFFLKHAGYSYDPVRETPIQGRRRCARALAQAEKHAREQDWQYAWIFDEDGCIGCDCGQADCACSTGAAHESLICVLRDDIGRIRATLGSVCNPTREYRRVVEAELALEVMPREVRA